MYLHMCIYIEGQKERERERERDREIVSRQSGGMWGGVMQTWKKKLGSMLGDHSHAHDQVPG